VIKIPGSEKIEYEKDQRDDTVVNTVPEEWLCGGGKKFEMTAKQDKCCDVPAHDKHSDGNTYEGETKNGDITQIFGCKKKRICAIIFHESSIDGSEENKPEYEQNLVPPEMQEQ
jgi:hypothetical protein